MQTPLIGEIFDSLRGMDAAKQVAILQTTIQKFPTMKIPLMTWLAIGFHPDIHFALPEGMPPFTVSDIPAGLNETNLFQAIKKVKMYLRVPEYAHVPMRKREASFVQLLESLHPLEVDVVRAAKAKTFPETYGLTLSTVQKAFPDSAKEFGPIEDGELPPTPPKVAPTPKPTPKAGSSKKKTKKKPTQKSPKPPTDSSPTAVSEPSEAPEPAVTVTPEQVEAAGGLLNALKRAAGRF